ncbi:MAG: DNA topoisomerase 4 subunit A, partial [Clostridia bacterium]|nr:DNA topoisomerase 4 subunit A [Clostridia bacterium]
MELNLEGLKIENIDIVKEIRRSYIDYSMSVIVGRALPDVRDGLKPVHRRILYAMYEDNLTHDKPFRKSATTVGDVLGRYHPHGDSAVYDAMVRLAQPFAMRYPLVEGHGNFGNIDGDGAAAYRYTEARMGRMADHMLRDIEKDVVDFTPNFDNTRKEPVVLPCRFPNLLANGSVGIAVGMATNIPPHNLNEIIDAVIYLMTHRDADVKELMQFVKGPDFPTYGVIHGVNGIEETYLTGRGKILMRGRTHFEERGKKESIVIDEIPYQVNKSNLVAGIADLVRNKTIEEIGDIRDESCKGKIRIVIDLKLGANREVVLNKLYRHSQLQETFAANMLALVNGEPRTLTLKQMLSHYLRFQEEVTRRRIEFDLNKALNRLHILEGYKIAIDNIEEVIRLIRESKTIPDAKGALMDRFDLSDAQGQAIVEMPLGRLAGLEIDKILEEMAEKRALVEKYQDILAHEEKLLAVLREDLEGIRARFGDERRTSIEEAADDIVLEDLIEKHTCVITITHAGYIKRQNVEEYAIQNRGGMGRRALTTREEDSVRDIFVSNSHNLLFFFSNKGRVFVRKCIEIPEASKIAKGTNVV